MQDWPHTPHPPLSSEKLARRPGAAEAKLDDAMSADGRLGAFAWTDTPTFTDGTAVLESPRPACQE